MVILASRFAFDDCNFLFFFIGKKTFHMRAATIISCFQLYCAKMSIDIDEYKTKKYSKLVAKWVVHNHHFKVNERI